MSHGAEFAHVGAAIVESSIPALQEAMAEGRLSARRLAQACLERIAAIDQAGPALRAVIEVNPDALAIADALDAERAAGSVRGPLHGIPVLLKDNIDTEDRMLTTAGSLALVGSRAAQDATAVARLRAAGAVILGKTNMSEWANFRSDHSTSGWSGRGGQTKNPHVLDRNPSGSSSGSAAAVAASLCAVAVGSETDGSIVSPASKCGVVGIKPTVGLVSRAGVIPISSTQDTLGPHARSVADAAILLGVLAGADLRDPATAAAPFGSYTQFLDPDGLRGARIGVLRDKGAVGYSRHTDAVFAQSLAALQRLGATLVDPVHIDGDTSDVHHDEFTVLLYEFQHDMAAYLATRLPGPDGAEPPRSLADLIAFNLAHAEQELGLFGQETFEQAAAKGPLSEPAYREALARSRDGSRARIDAALAGQRLDAIVAPTGQPAWPIDPVNGDPQSGGASAGAAARAGYPLITVPAGAARGLPIGITFIGGAYSEPTLVRLAYAFEQGTRARRAPGFLPTVG